ncbi:MAG: hypothetical protein ABW007_22235, partial [Chitinophagaceae bacterium]
TTAFTKRQNEFLTDLRNGVVDFEVRSEKFASVQNGGVPQGAIFNIKAVVKSAGDGTTTGTATFTKFTPSTNSWT